MKRKPNTRSTASAAAVLSAGVLMAHGPGATAQQATTVAPPAQQGAAARSAQSTHIKFAAKLHKDPGSLSVAGMQGGRPVFKNAQGEFFQVEPNTGDFKFLSAESLGYIKVDGSLSRSAPAKGSTFIKFDGIKGEQKVSLAGVDDAGNVIQENARGERFYLGPNGDMVFVK